MYYFVLTQINEPHKLTGYIRGTDYASLHVVAPRICFALRSGASDLLRSTQWRLWSALLHVVAPLIYPVNLCGPIPGYTPWLFIILRQNGSLYPSFFQKYWVFLIAKVRQCDISHKHLWDISFLVTNLFLFQLHFFYAVQQFNLDLTFIFPAFA